MDFPSLRGRELRSVLEREPLAYETVRQRGSHRKMESRNGYRDVRFSFHDGVTVPGRTVKKVLVSDVGLSEDEARDLV